MEQVRLKDIAEIVTGSTPATKTSAFFGGDIPFVTPSELNGASPIVAAPTTLTSQGAAQVRVVPKDAVLVCCIGSLGKIGIAGVSLATNQQINAVVFDDSKVFPRYGLHCCRLLKPVLEHMAPATTVKIVNKSRFSNLTIPLPPLPKQRRIAAILDKADELRAKRRAALDQLNGLTQSVFLEMFGDPATNRKGFPISRMGDVCDVRDGTHDSPKYVSVGGYPLITSKNLTGGFVDLINVNFISEADYLQINKRSKVDRGDIVMPMIGTIGSPVLVEDEPCYAIKNVALIKFCEASPSAVFVRQLLRSDFFDHIVKHTNRGGTQKFVSLGDLRDLPLPLPPRDLQQQFASRVTAVENARGAFLGSCQLLDGLFASLQHQAFSGAL